MALTKIKNIEELIKVMAMPVADSTHNNLCDDGDINGVGNNCPFSDQNIEFCLLFEEDLEPSLKYDGRYKRCQKCLDNFVVKTDI